MAHQIPFRKPATTVPLSWSFAGSSHSIQNHQLLLPRKNQPSSSTSTTLPSTQSRKRSAPDELCNLEDTQPGNHSKFISALPKRAKRASPTTPSSRQSPHPGLQHLDGLGSKDDQVELGTALISLTKNELVNLLHGLIQQKPELKSTIQNLLPPPSLESILVKLTEVENNLVETIPNKRTNRDEYIWNRVRVPLMSYVNDCSSCLEIAAQTIERRCSSQGGGKIELSEVYGAVSDQLTLLSQLSLSVSKVESLLPSLSNRGSNSESTQDVNWNVAYPFQSILIPSLFQNWKMFIEIIHKLIFIDRMILSESLIRKWFNLLDELSSNHSLNHNQSLFSNHVVNSSFSSDDNHTVQRLMISIRDEAQNRFGCLVGLKR